MAIKPILRGLATYLPFVKRYTNRGSGGTDSARYCYTVWLRHLLSLHEIGVDTDIQVVAELGPGDSLGTGIAAVLSGVKKYYALDVKPYFNNQTNLKMFDQLLELFRKREPLPDEQEFPGVRPKLADYSFPQSILHAQKLNAALDPGRVASLRSELAGLANQRQGGHFSYFAPWDDSAVVQPNTVDLAFSQAVMEHVVDIDSTYAALAKWIKPGGYMSHTIDFRSHHTAPAWNGHWAYSDLIWKIIVGTRAFLINRQPYSSHVSAMQKHGFELRNQQRARESGGLPRHQLAPRFRDLADMDLITSGAYIVAQRNTRTADVSSGR